MEALRRIAVGKAYLQLVKKFPLRPLRSREELRVASKILGEIGVKGPRMTQEERDYFEVLAHLVGEYENKTISAPKITPREALQFLMEENGLTQTELARQTGIPRSVITEFLNGRRGLSKASVLKLAERFRVEPGLFLVK